MTDNQKQNIDEVVNETYDCAEIQSRHNCTASEESNRQPPKPRLQILEQDMGAADEKKK
jgi:hypothetical protein